MIKMNVKHQQICRLCLKVAKDEYLIEDVMKQMFEVLLLTLDLDITKDPIICQDCLEVSKKCLNFKYTYFDTEEFILSYSADRKEAKHDIKVVYEEIKHAQIVFDEDFNICRFCMIRLEKNNFTSIEDLVNDSMFEMLSHYMIELDFKTTETPMVCANCKEDMDRYFKFVLNCLGMEEKIKTYCKEKGTDNMGQVKLSNVLFFMCRDVLHYHNQCSQTCKLKQEHTECVLPEEYIGLIKQEEVDVKDKGMVLTENSYKDATDFKLDGNKDMFPSKEYGEETKSDMIHLKTRGHKNQENTGKVTCQSKQKLKVTKNISILKDTPDLHLQSYISVDKNIHPMYECSLCTYQAKQKSRLVRHMLVHKDLSEIKMYKCSLCTYEAKQKSLLVRHMLVHKDVSEIKMYKCSLCAYQAKQKNHLKTHMLVHKDVSEIKMYKCSLCTYEADYKSSLITHMVVHKNVSEIEMYKCPLCTFETKHKGSLRTHMLVHKDISEIKMYKCALCTYEAKQKGNLNTHMSVHKDISEMKAFKCSLCCYKAKHKGSVKKHMSVHKSSYM